MHLPINRQLYPNLQQFPNRQQHHNQPRALNLRLPSQKRNDPFHQRPIDPQGQQGRRMHCSVTQIIIVEKHGLLLQEGFHV